MTAPLPAPSSSSSAPALTPAAAFSPLALLFSGQGAQFVGMGRELCAASPAAAAVFRRADEVLGRPLSQVAFAGPEEELTRTGNCQPALFVHGLAALAALRERLGGDGGTGEAGVAAAAAPDPLPVAAAAGLSLGEFTAHAAAGTFSFEDGLRLVERRGQLMEEACRREPGAMAALLGGDEAAASALAAAAGVDVANLNCPGQTVVSGSRDAVARAVARAREHGFRRATPLNVAGAYHSRLMAPAAAALREALARQELRPPRFPVVANVDARPAPADDPAAVRGRLTAQVTGTVRWQQSVEYLVDQLGCRLFLELGPGEVLAGLVRRTRPEAEVLPVGDPATLAAAVDRLRPAPAVPGPRP